MWHELCDKMKCSISSLEDLNRNGKEKSYEFHIVIDDVLHDEKETIEDALRNQWLSQLFSVINEFDLEDAYYYLDNFLFVQETNYGFCKEMRFKQNNKFSLFIHIKNVAKVSFYQI
jgi:hypothetical protein